MANSIVRLPTGYFPDPDTSRPLFFAKIYIGEPDLDPKIPANQKTVTGRREDGVEVTLAQPIRTNRGGVPVDGTGNVVTLLVDGAYSMTVDDRKDAQKYNFANVQDGAPVTFEVFGETLAGYTNVDFKTVSDAKAGLLPDGSTINLEVGYKVTTRGYHSENDGGGGEYIVVAGGTGTDDGGSYHDMANENQLELTIRETVSPESFGCTGNGSVDCTPEFTKLVSFSLLSGVPIYGNGEYLTTSSITDIHNVRKLGSGSIKRGVDTFYFLPDETRQNTIYGSASGLSSNDGLSSSEPLLTVQDSIDVLEKYNGISESIWTLKFAAGTYTEGGVLDKIRGFKEVVFEGSLNAGSPSSIIDGATASNFAGINCNNTCPVRIKNFKAQNFSLSGFLIQNGTLGVIDTCDAENNAFANFNCSEFSEMAVVGTVNSFGAGCQIGFRYYRNSEGAIGDGINPVTIQDHTGSGIQSREGSHVVCLNNLTIQNLNAIAGTTAGIYCYKGGYVELRDTSITNCEIGINLESGGIFDNQTGIVSFTGNALDKKVTSYSVDRSNFNLIEDNALYLIPFGAPSGMASNSNYDLVIDHNNTSGIQALLNGNSFNIDVDKLERLTLNPADHSFRVTLNNVETYRFKTTELIPIPDSTKGLGSASNRWSEVFSANGVINTSDEREKTQVSPVGDVVLDAWASVEYIKYKWIDSVDRKGSEARYHIGLLAQDIKRKFEEKGLDATDYGLLCYNEWSDELDDDGNIVILAGNRWGIRSDQCLFLESALMRRELDRLKEKLGN